MEECCICSKLRQNLSEMEVSTFERIQRVVWDHLLPFRVKLSRNFISSCLEKLITRKERQMKLTRFIFSRCFEVIVTPLLSDKY